MTPDTNQTAGDVAAKMEAEEFWITEYLSAGGLFNPEMMNHDKVRDALMRHRDVFTSAIAQLKRMAAVEAALAHRWECQQVLERTVTDLQAALSAEREMADALASALDAIDVYEVYAGESESRDWARNASCWLYPNQGWGVLDMKLLREGLKAHTARRAPTTKESS